MATKIRYRTQRNIYPSYDQLVQDSNLDTYYGLRGPNGSYYPDNDCYHFQVTRPGTYKHFSSEDDILWHAENADLGAYAVNAFPAIQQAATEASAIELNFQQNNDFELIPFLMDLDGTIAMFTTRFLRSLSYGSVTWGILPFVSDVVSLYNSVRDTFGGLLESYESISGKRISRRFPFQGNYTYPGVAEHSFEGFASLSGHVDLDRNSIPDNHVDLLRVFLDEIGLHFDLRTAWDVIPLSFAVDYIVPVGDVLETLHPRGWFNPTFRLTGGTYSIQTKIEQSGVSLPTGEKRVFNFGYKLYTRSRNIPTLPSRPTVLPSFSAPSPREIFNIAYLANSFRGRFR